jgi:DNA polymerase IV
MSTTTYRPSKSPPAEDPDPTAPSASLFEGCPPIFVLPTHLSLDELHEVEDSLVTRGAPLTYDVSEARIVLGTIGQRKRAALELRSRGVWTEEIIPPTAATKAVTTTALDQQPPLKRRRVDKTAEQVSSPSIVNLSTESEEEDAGAGGAKKHLRRPSLSPDTSLTDGMTDRMATTDSEPEEMVPDTQIKVVKLEWLTQSLKEGKLLPLDAYVVYDGRVIARPDDKKTFRRAALRDTDAHGILERAMEDASSQPPPVSASSRFGARRMKHPPDEHHQSQQHHHPPKLYRQTTSEHEQTIPLPPAPDWVKNHVMYACMRSAPLHPPNEKFMEQLQKIRRVRELTLDEIGVRAYSTSIAAIAAYPYEFRTPTEILSVPGCEMKIANLWVEFQNSPDGTLEAAEALHQDPVLRVLHQFANIWGVGPKTAREFYYQRGWRDLDDVIEHGWNSLSRVQQIGVKYYDEFLAGIPRGEVSAIAKTIHRHANLVRPGCDYDGRGMECVIVGGYRRGKEVCGDIDLVLSHRDERITKNLVVDIVSSLESEGLVTHTLALIIATSNREQQTLPFRGETGAHHFDSLDKALVVWQDPYSPEEKEEEEEENEAEEEIRKSNPNPHRRVDIIISPWRTVGCAVLGWSGDTTFERDLRRHAKKAHGWKFDSSGVRERTTGGKVVDLEGHGTTWEERERLVMEGLGVGWRPATERCTR